MIIGIDEAGRGALAGPVVAGAVTFNGQLSMNNCSVFDSIKDSKKLTDAQRRQVYAWLVENVGFGVASVSAALVDELGIKRATERAMNLALEDLLSKSKEPVIARQTSAENCTKPSKSDFNPPSVPPSGREGIRLLIDGRDKFQFPYPSEDIVKGDEKILEISAASIMAKVTRDDAMIELDKQFPKFGFKDHKGYGAAAHYALLDQGIYCDEHRQSYDPLKTWLNQGRLF